MSIDSYAELVHMNNGKIELDELKFRYEVFGGNARHVLNWAIRQLILPAMDAMSILYPYEKSMQPWEMVDNSVSLHLRQVSGKEF